MITRPLLPFTPVEVARAKAVLDLQRHLAGAPAAADEPKPSDGMDVVIRPAVFADAAAIEDMHERCSSESRVRRYGSDQPPAVERLLRHKATRTFLAETQDGGVVAVATVRISGRCAEAGILVEDQWQGRRIGTALLDRLITLARTEDSAAIVAIAQETNTAMIRAMRRSGAQADHVGPDLAYLTLHLDPRSGAPGPRSDGVCHQR